MRLIPAGGNRMEMNFRPLRHTDYSELKRMIHALYVEDPVNEPITDKKISKTVIELRRKPCKGKILIFEKDNVTIGYSILVFYWSNEYGGDILHIDELYVKPEYRERGAATCFFKHIARTYGGQVVALQLEVSPSNIRAMNYYKKLGFKRTRNVHLTHTR
jgi:ribosomal protein S18 acetylase RimI-like enzyme